MNPMDAVLACLFLSAVVACASGTNELTVKEFTAARKLYEAKCAKCHRFYEPKKYSEADWRTWMNKMSAKSKLKPDQEDLLKRYLDAYRADRLPSKPPRR